MQALGHYYTTYYTALYLGVEKDLAFKCAFYSYWADQVRQTDAVYSGLRSGTEQYLSIPFYENWRDIVKDDELKKAIFLIDIGDRPWSMTNLTAVSLHALSGISYQMERNLCKRLLTQTIQVIPVQIPLIGLLIHRFGDAFSHSKPGTDITYPAWLGHGLHGSSPDYIHLRKRIFLDYITQLKPLLSNLIKIKPSKNQSPPSYPQKSTIDYKKSIQEILDKVDLMKVRINKNIKLGILKPVYDIRKEFDNDIAINCGVMMEGKIVTNEFVVEKLTDEFIKLINGLGGDTSYKPLPGPLAYTDYSKQYIKNITNYPVEYYLLLIAMIGSTIAGYYHKNLKREDYKDVWTKEHIRLYGPTITYMETKKVLLECKNYWDSIFLLSYSCLQKNHSALKNDLAAVVKIKAIWKKI